MPAQENVQENMCARGVRDNRNEADRRDDHQKPATRRIAQRDGRVTVQSPGLN